MAAPVIQVLAGPGLATDITSAVSLSTGLQVQRGRSDEFSEVQPSTLTLGLDISKSTVPSVVTVGAPIRVRVTVNGVTTNRFTGTVESVTTTWPTDGKAASLATVTAVDLMASLNRRRLPATLAATTYAAGPTAYWPMHEAEGATSVGDFSGNNWPPLVLAQRGTGGTFTTGSGDGAPTQSLGTATFERASATTGPYLTATLPQPLPISGRSGTVSWGFLVSFVVTSSTVAAQTFVRLRRPDTEKQDGTPLLDIGCDASGNLKVSSAFKAGFTDTSTAMLCDGLPHHVMVHGFAHWIDNPFETTFDPICRVDGVAVSMSGGGSITYTSAWPGITRIDVGGSASTGALMASASISELAYFPIATPSAATVALGPAASTGFTADRTDQRIARYCDWLGIADRALQVGAVTSTAHQDTTDQSPIAAMNAVAATERGMVFVNGSGSLVFHARSHRYTPWWTTIRSATDLDSSLTFTTDTQSLINKATVSRPGGASAVSSDLASIAAYGEYPIDVELLFTNDTDAASAAQWLVNTNDTPRPRVSTVTVDLLTQTATVAAEMQALELGSLIGISDLPPQAPSANVSLFVEGWSETISLTAWDMQLNTSPWDSVLSLDNFFYGLLDHWRLV